MSRNESLRSRAVPAWLAVPLTAFIVLSPIALFVGMTGDTQWQDYLMPAALGGVLLLVMLYWLQYFQSVERRLHQERNLLQVLIDHLPDRIFIKDLQGRRTLANAADWQAVGATKMEEILGKTVFEIYPAELAARYWEDDQEVLQTGESVVNREEPAQDAGGKPIWTLATQVPLRDTDGKLVGLVGMIRDITAFKQATQAALAAEERYRAIFEESVEGIYQSTPDGRLLTANPALASMLGYASPEEMVSSVNDLELQIYVDPTRRSHFQRAVESRGTIAAFESEVYRKDGVKVWISENGRAVRDDNGSVLYYEGTMVDITERKRAEAAQRAAEEKYRSFFENSVAGIFQLARDGRFIAANPALAAMLGYSSPEDLISSITDVRHELYVDPQARAQLDRQLSEDGRASGFEAELKCKDGNTIYALANILLVRDAAGQPACYEGTLQDITARKQIEHTEREAQRRQHIWIAELERRTREISLLNEMSDLIQSCPTVEDAYTVIAQQAQWLFPEDCGALYIINSSQGLAQARAVWGSPFGDAHDFEPHDCWAVRRGQMHTVESVWADDPNINEPLLFCKHVHEPMPEAYICMPLATQGETLGILHLRHHVEAALSPREPRGIRYNEEMRQLANTVAHSLALSISNLHLRESLRQQSIRDPLTGMFNRRYMEESLGREVARAARLDHPLGVIMLDVDHFKGFNDEFGHAAGDAVLHQIGGLLRASVRQADIPCRYGGEEFVLIMPDASLKISAERAESIRQAVKRLDLQLGGRMLGPVTVSIGVAEFPMHGRSGDAVIQMADRALYEAKQAGRDRVVVTA